MYVWCKFSFTICNINRLGADKWCVCASVPITFNFTYQHVFMASYFIEDNMYWYTLELGSDWYCSFRKCTKLKYFICSSCQLLSFLVKFFSTVDEPWKVWWTSYDTIDSSTWMSTIATKGSLFYARNGFRTIPQGIRRARAELP